MTRFSDRCREIGRWRWGPILPLGLIAMLSGCIAGAQPKAMRVPASIDGLYLLTAQILEQPDRDHAAALRDVTAALDDLALADDNGRDPCQEQKRRQLMPIIMTLGVINGLRDPDEKKTLRGQALEHLAELSSPAATAMTGDICFGRGFPPLLVSKP